jgi:hypothetical protein
LRLRCASLRTGSRCALSGCHRDHGAGRRSLGDQARWDDLLGVRPFRLCGSGLGGRQMLAGLNRYARFTTLGGSNARHVPLIAGPSCGRRRAAWWLTLYTPARAFRRLGLVVCHYLSSYSSSVNAVIKPAIHRVRILILTVFHWESSFCWLLHAASVGRRAGNLSSLPNLAFTFYLNDIFNLAGR